ncbi:MAG: VanZ family protein [Erysipelotrichaceae bacterium]|nr:VanZ family protein [Erysipelotrichaceae bacterium]
MTKISFVAGELFFSVIWLIIRVITWLKQGKIDWKREALLLLMYVNLAVIIRFAFFPMARINGKIQPLIFEADKVFPFKVNMEPFVHLAEYDNRKHMILNLIGNIGMFIPSGIILPIIYKKLNSFGKIVLTGFLMSLAIEILQLPFAVRTSDVDDLLLNTAGVNLGYVIYSMFRKGKD